MPYTLSRASMQATTATCAPGGMGRCPLENDAAYSWLLRIRSSVVDTVPPRGVALKAEPRQGRERRLRFSRSGGSASATAAPGPRDRRR